MNDSSKGRYDIILCKYISTALGIDIKLSENFSKANDGPLKGSSAPMIDLGTYEIKYLNTDKSTPEELFYECSSRRSI